MPRPPRRAGNASRSLMMSLKETWPVRFGRKPFLIVSSSGLRRVSMQVGPSTCQTVSECSIGRLWLGCGYG